MAEPTNRLINASSPYLLQHAHNPVNWYPWCEEALNKAREEDKPIIVSIGYSACHWCHVMERECFENEAIAELMNKHYVSIKVDREERPDVDQLYMEALHSMGQQGGWPLNVFLTPNQKPFYGGTYFPARNWVTVLNNVANVFQQQREELDKTADEFARTLAIPDTERFGLKPPPSITDQQLLNMLEKAFLKFSEQVDEERGGMMRAPKFPMPSNWIYCLRYHALTGNETAKKQALVTLNAMANGGIYDQVGGGFARYSTDVNWLVPHFEKMLYDNAQLLSLYAEAYRLSGEQKYLRVIRETVGFLKRELGEPNGGYYSALDADSEGEEGRFYVWNHDEFTALLSPDHKLPAAYYNVSEPGNWEEGKNILHVTRQLEDVAAEHGMTHGDAGNKIEQAKERLFNAREKRVRPGLDDKVLAAWNGLLLRGLCDAWLASQDNNTLEKARQLGTFIIQHLVRETPDGETALWRNYKDGNASINAYLDDYAFVIDGFIALYQCNFNPDYLYLANKLCQYTLKHFYDQEEGLFHYTDDQDPALIARKKELFDNVIPASNSAMARNLNYLHLLLENADYDASMQSMAGKMAALVITDPVYLSNWAILLTELTRPMAEVAVVGPEATTLAAELQQAYLPNKVVCASAEKNEYLPLLAGREAINGKTTIYVCVNRSCQLPVHTVEEALEQIKAIQQ